MKNKVVEVKNMLKNLGQTLVGKGFVIVGGIKYAAPELLGSNWKGRWATVFINPRNVGRVYLYLPTQRTEAINTELLGHNIDSDVWRAAKKNNPRALSLGRALAAQRTNAAE